MNAPLVTGFRGMGYEGDSGSPDVEADELAGTSGHENALRFAESRIEALSASGDVERLRFWEQVVGHLEEGERRAELEQAIPGQCSIEESLLVAEAEIADLPDCPILISETAVFDAHIQAVKAAHRNTFCIESLCVTLLNQSASLRELSKRAEADPAQRQQAANVSHGTLSEMLNHIYTLREFLGLPVLSFTQRSRSDA